MCSSGTLLSRAVSARQIMLAITPSISSFQSSPRTLAMFQKSCFSSSLTIVINWLTMSSISELIPFSSSLFFLWNCSLVSSCWFLSEEKPTSFYSTVSRVTEDCMSFLTSMTPPKWFCILYSSAISETLGCTPWMDTLNRLNALHLNATLLPRIVMSYVGKSCAACSLSNLTSMNLLHRDIILYVVVNLTVPNSGEHLHICIKFFQLALSIKNIL